MNANSYVEIISNRYPLFITLLSLCSALFLFFVFFLSLAFFFSQESRHLRCRTSQRILVPLWGREYKDCLVKRMPFRCVHLSQTIEPFQLYTVVLKHLVYGDPVLNQIPRKGVISALITLWTWSLAHIHCLSPRL